MSKESLDQFMNQVADSEELQARIGEEIDAETLIALGAEHGCEFTAEDLQEPGELSDEELAEVAGGIKQPESQGSGLTYNSKYGRDMYHFRCSIGNDLPMGMP